MPGKMKLKQLTPSQEIQRDISKSSKERKFLAKIFDHCMAQDRVRFEIKEKPKKIRHTDIEMFWFKKWGKNPVLATQGSGVGMCWPRKPKRGEYMEIHYHPRNSALPSCGDLQKWVKIASKSRKNAPVIAVTTRGKHVGYTFVIVRDWKKAKEVFNYDIRKKLSIEEIKALGFQIRFVPLQGYAFDERKKQFIKKNPKSGK